MSQLILECTGGQTMAEPSGQVIAVAGATGLQDGVVTRQLLEEGWRVRALTRNPERKKVRSVASLGAEIVGQTWMPPSLERAFDGVSGVFGVQTTTSAAMTGSWQGRNVTDAAQRVGVRHVVYAAAGVGRQGTGIGSWDGKDQIVRYMSDRDLPGDDPASNGVHGAHNGVEVLSGSLHMARHAQELDVPSDGWRSMTWPSWNHALTPPVPASLRSRADRSPLLRGVPQRVRRRAPDRSTTKNASPSQPRHVVNRYPGHVSSSGGCSRTARGSSRIVPSSEPDARAPPS
jgi:hypothetical protein